MFFELFIIVNKRCIHNSLNRMHTVLRLIKYDRLRTFEYFICHFHCIQTKFFMNFFSDFCI